ncbi:TlpA family protein disulfide reductase [Sphingomonas sp. HMP6]|uniref:TlpA family protein disulfide reductase n=1 Tax=Sphingomonas sp. HMP6 TaxID=1517551 RepID=UPI001E52A02D|nr:TlpA disulfide reductase family protein [Sphingomonas sp. HMP6]
MRISLNSAKRIVAGAGLCLAAPLLLGASGPAKVGAVAPPFELTLMDGTKISSAGLRGQVVVLNFWATWCVPCRAELPLLDRYYEIQRDRGLRVFAITTEDSLQLYQLKKLFAVMKIPAIRKLKGNYGSLGGVPTNYIIDRAGRIRYAKAAAFDLDALNKELVPLLLEPAPAPTS